MSISSEDRQIFEFIVLYAGWEVDSKAWIMERPNGSRYLCMTDHGSKYEASTDELSERIAFYEATIAQSRAAIALLAEDSA